MARYSLDEELWASEKGSYWQKRQAKRRSTCGDVWRIIWTVLLVIFTTFTVGRELWDVHHSASTKPEEVHGQPSIGFRYQQTVSRMFENSTTFIEAPSLESDRAWKSLFPS